MMKVPPVDFEGNDRQSDGLRWRPRSGHGDPALGARLVGRVMKRDVPLARPDFLLDSVAAVLLRGSIAAIAVVDELCRPLGIITCADVLREFTGREDGAPTFGAGLGRRRYHDDLRVFLPPRATARDVMMPLVETLSERDSVAHAAARLGQLGVDQLVVTEAGHTFAGLLTTRDIAELVAAYTRHAS